MKIYFLSSTPCALTVNQAFFGMTDLFERSAELVLSDNLFVQFTPQNALPISFFLTDNIRFSAPEGVEVYFVQDGIALYAKDFPPADYTLQPIAQAQDGNCLITVFRQGKIQFTMQTPTAFYTGVLSPSFLSCTIEFFDGLIFLSSPSELFVYTRAGACVLHEQIQEFHVKNGTLFAVLPLLDSLGRYAHVEYALTGESCERTAFSLSQTRARDGSNEASQIQADLLAFAFFETVLIGGDFQTFLSAELQKKSDTLREFLGDFIAVVPTANASVCGLIKPIGERIFNTVYYTVTVENGEICDIQV